MSMLAEKKKREKWCLNPRGKAWSEDQNKFGQRLMEKMGWKAGQGLGANNQGPTDIVKVKMKDDNKGLGFKDNGEEWLKTTSEFNQLLDQLGSGTDDIGDQSDIGSSLEHRSKNSKARVHYHKFTRGKDLSRYSEKDLASIIGPDVIKPKESTTYYSANQVNKGSLDEYFKKKAKRKHDQLIQSNSTEEKLDSKKETDMQSTTENNNKLNSEDDSDATHKKKRKKKHKELNADETVNKSFEESSSLLLNESSTKEKKKQRIHAENLIEEIQPPSETCELEKNSKKKKRKLSKEETITPNVTCDTVQSVEDFPTEEESISKKKKKKSKKEHVSEEFLKSALNETENNEMACDEIVCNKEKRKKRVCDKNNEVEPAEINEKNVFHQTEIAPYSSSENQDNSTSKTSKTNIECSQSPNNNKTQSIIDLNLTEGKSKKKKKKIEQNTSELESNETTNTDFADIPETLESEMTHKKKKKKLNSDNLLISEHQQNVSSLCTEEPIAEQQDITEKKLKKEKKNKNCSQDNIVENDQVNSSEKCGDFLEVCGRKTSLKKINNPCKKSQNDKYDTEDFISFTNTDNEANADPSMITLQENNNVKSEKNIDGYDNKNRLVLHREVNSDDCNIPREVVNYESKLVLTKLKALKVARPDVLVAMTNGQYLSGSQIRKLRALHRVRYFKSLLPQKEVAKIDIAVSKFHNQIESDENKIIAYQETKPEVTSKSEIPIELQQPIKCKKKSDVFDESTNCMIIYRDSTNGYHDIPKHVAAYEYRLIMARFKKLKITPPNVKVRVSDSKLINQTTHRKLKQIHKSKYLKTLLPSKDVSEIDQSVQIFFDDLKPKIEMMKVVADVEEKIADVAENIGETENPIGHLEINNENKIKITKENKPVEIGLSENINLLKNMSQQLEKIAKSIGKSISNDSNTNLNALEESATAEKIDENCTLNEEKENASKVIEEKPKSLLQVKLEGKLTNLKEQIQMLADGKRPPTLNRNKSLQVYEEEFWTAESDRPYQNTSYFRGRLAHNVGRQRGGRGVVMQGRCGFRNLQYNGSGFEQGRSSYSNRGCFGRGQREFEVRGRGVKNTAFPSGGWGALKLYNSILDQHHNFNNTNFRSGFQRQTGHYSVRSRSSFRGRGRGDRVVRGRISQNNFDAKCYAQKCKEQNLMPDVCFKGVDLKIISGYAAGLKPGSVDVAGSDNLKTNTEIIKNSSEFSEIIINKEKNIKNDEVVNECKEEGKRKEI